jgi:hypothetical protein
MLGPVLNLLLMRLLPLHHVPGFDRFRKFFDLGKEPISSITLDTPQSARAL